MVPFFPEFFTWCNVPLENLTEQFDLKDQLCPSSVKTTSISGALHPWNTQPNFFDSFCKASEPFQNFSLTFYWAACQAQYV